MRLQKLQKLQEKNSTLKKMTVNAKTKKAKRKLSNFLESFSERSELQNWQRFAAVYNAKLEKVLSDQKIYEEFETIVEEQKAILMIDGKISDREAETRIMDFENLRQIVMSL